jgi:hypothetical protein
VRGVIVPAREYPGIRGFKVLALDVIALAFRSMENPRPTVSNPAIIWLATKKATRFFDLAGWDQRYVIEKSNNPSWLACAQASLELGQSLTAEETKFLQKAIKEIAA